MKRMRLRYDGLCAVCSTAVPARSEAWWDSGEKLVTCLACYENSHETAVPTESTTSAPGPHPKVGGFLLAVSDDPRSTKVWDQGAVGEERVASTLEASRPRGIEVLHDRRIPRSKANIDHLVVAPSGVWVVDAKRYLNGKLERRDVGGWFRTDLRLYIGNRDRSSLLGGVRRQIEIVTDALAGTEFTEIPVHGTLCFVEVQLGWFAKPFTIDGVHVTWRKHLVGPMLQPTIVTEATRHDLARRLAAHFKPA